MNGTRDDQTFSALMRAAQAGDARAYSELLKEITPRLRAMIRRHRRFFQADDIEDLVQDVLLSIHAVRATYDPQRPFMPWVMAITRNRLVDGARRYGRQAAHEVAAETISVTFPDDEANNVVEDYGDPEALKQAIRNLPSGQRQAVELLKLREMSLKEASAASGMTIGALKVSAHRAVTTLRRLLAKG